MKKIVFLALILLLLSTAMSGRFIRPVEASGTIYIKPDGSIDPPTANITTVDKVTYTFNGNIYDSIVIERDNIVVDGADYTVQGTGSGTGILLGGVYWGRSNVTIKNMEIKSFWNGILLRNSSNNTISGNNITENDHFGISALFSSNNTISGNNITNNEFGIYLDESSNNKFYHNNFIDNIQQVNIHKPGYANFCDNGVGGNYWSNYADRYPDAEEIDGSGIWYTPYFIDENNQDNYPLMSPWSPPSVEEVPFWTQWWFWALVIAGIVALAGVIYFLKKRKPPTASTSPTEGTLQNIHRAYSCLSHLQTKTTQNTVPLK